MCPRRRISCLESTSPPTRGLDSCESGEVVAISCVVGLRLSSIDDRLSVDVSKDKEKNGWPKDCRFLSFVSSFLVSFFFIF